MAYAIIQDSGSGNIDKKEIAAPCKGIFTISGYVYVDESNFGQKDPGEGGIGNVTVHILKNNDNNFEMAEKTSADGSYSFSVVTGNTSTDFTIEVRNTTDDETDFNELLFNSYSPTTNPPMLSVTVNKKDVTGKNLGFRPETQKIINDFEVGEIKLRTEKPDFWANEFKFADKGRKTLFTKSELLSFLNLIDNMGLTYNFDFGISDDDRIANAQKILTTKRNSSDFQLLEAELLAVGLNVASGNGAVDENDIVLEGFNNLIITTGAAAAATAAGNVATQVSGSTASSATFSTSSSSSDSDSLLLLSAFNGSGGGVGN